MASTAEPVVVTVNGGSSSIKFAVFEGRGLGRLMSGSVERIGLAEGMLVVKTAGVSPEERTALGVLSQAEAARRVVKILHERVGKERIAGIGHRVVHGGLQMDVAQRVTPEVMAALGEARALDMAHLPGEVGLIEVFGAAFSGVEQVVCFDTAFHRGMPGVAKRLGIPRKYMDAGVRRFGFHGLSYTYLMEELERVAGPEAARGKVVLAHLGSGASMAAVKEGRAVDTTMGFTPTSGLVMGTRPGDLDGGLLVYLMRKEGLDADALDALINRRCGLLGVSGSSSDMRDLLQRRGTDPRAAEAVELFCYTARRWLGALAAAMGGLETVVFSGGIGEHAEQVRAEICGGLEFLGVQVDGRRNAAGEAVISAAASRVMVRVIATDEEVVMAREVRQVLGLGGA